jgi:hypothetical protein
MIPLQEKKGIKKQKNIKFWIVVIENLQYFMCGLYTSCIFIGLLSDINTKSGHWQIALPTE